MPGRQASRPPWRALVLALAASLVVGLSGCAGPGRISVSGNVDDDLVMVQVPQLEIPQPDLDAGFAPAGGETSSPATRADAPVMVQVPALEIPQPDLDAGFAPAGGETSSPANARIALGSWNRVAVV